MHLSIRLHWLGESRPGNWRIWKGPVPSAWVKHFLKCLQRQKDVDYLLMAKPVAFNHLRIRRDCCEKKCHQWYLFLPVVGSSLWRPWSLLLSCDKEKCVWNMWDRGTWWFCHWLGIRLVRVETPEILSRLCQNLWPLNELPSEKVTVIRLRVSGCCSHSFIGLGASGK